MGERSPFVPEYDWRDPAVTAHWDAVRAKISAGQHVDAHDYRENARQVAVDHIEIAVAILKETKK